MHDLASAVGGRLGVGGARLTVSGACASGLGALIRAVMMVRGGEARRVLVVAAEASVEAMFVGSFRRLGVLAREGAGCRPFDRGREGFVMSEAGAAVCVEASPNDQTRMTNESRMPNDESAIRAPSLVRHSEFGLRYFPVWIERFAMGGDAVHLTGGDAEGRVLRRLLGEVIGGRRVDLVHAHGTGTGFNDPVELAAIESVLDSVESQRDEETRGRGEGVPRAVSLSAGPPVPLSFVPVLYSHKGALGHSLGAAGLVSVVVNCMCHREGVIPPNVQTDDPLEMRGVRLNRAAERRAVGRSVAMAAGFGGAVAVVGLYGGGGSFDDIRGGE